MLLLIIFGILWIITSVVIIVNFNEEYDLGIGISFMSGLLYLIVFGIFYFSIQMIWFNFWVN